MRPNEDNTRARFSEYDLHQEKKSLAAKIRMLRRPASPTNRSFAEAWNQAIEEAASTAER